LVSGVSNIHLWVTEPHRIDDVLLRRYEALLEPAELRRMNAFRFERHRREYLVTRALVRTTLSRYRPGAPEAWRFRTNEYGRPTLEDPAGLYFNLANHPTMVVCAVARHLDIGVDVEPLDRAGDLLELAPTVFSPVELAELGALPADARRDRALALWTLKEAYIKARGMGLSLPLAGFSFRFGHAHPEIGFHDGVLDEPGRWAFRTLDLAQHCLAVAFGGPEAQRLELGVTRTVPLAGDS
jgi:4'-phosphopantetheinyl transferase